jgi:uncharacterized Fe-S cluster protein YjdI
MLNSRGRKARDMSTMCQHTGRMVKRKDPVYNSRNRKAYAIQVLPKDIILKAKNKKAASRCTSGKVRSQVRKQKL